jgi:hypothetical protein
MGGGDSSTQHRLIAGAAAGLVCDAFVHPMDTIRCRLQVERGNSMRFGGSIGGAFMRIIQNEGIRSLYKGFGIVSVFTIPAHALYYTGYETSKGFLVTQWGENSRSVYFASGMCAELCGALLWCPMDVIKQRVQIHISYSHQNLNSTLIKHQNRNSWNVFTSIMKTEGVVGLYRGFGAALLTYMPFMGIYFTSYEEIKKMLQSFHRPSHLIQTNQVILPFTSHLVGAAMAGGIAAAISCPFDVMKTRIQVYFERRCIHYSSLF